MDGKSYRRFTVEPCLNGLMVSIGCQWAVYTDIAVFLADMGQYLVDPVKKEEELLKNSWASRAVPAINTVSPDMQDNLVRGNESLQPAGRGISRG
jgi:hypothetical protein